MSRLPPKMEQQAAIEAKKYHVLPISTNGRSFSVETFALGNLAGQAHDVVCKSDNGREVWRTRIFERMYEPMLETDVQDVFAVDLYFVNDKVIVKLEYHEPIELQMADGQLLQ